MQVHTRGVRLRSLALATLLAAPLPFAAPERAEARKPAPLPKEKKAETSRVAEPSVPPGPEASGSGYVAATTSTAAPVEATATVWAQAGSRSWTGCSAVASEAAKQLWALSEDTNNFRSDHHWAIQARECPNAPEVLTMAVRHELMRRFELPEALDERSDLTMLAQDLIDSRTRAIGWIDDAEAELARRQDDRTLGLSYWRGRARLAAGDYEGAVESFEKALRDDAIEGWKIRRLLALAVLYQGDLDRALLLAFRAYVDAQQGDRLMSEYVLALVLDRSGDSASSRRRMKDALDRDGDGGRLRVLEAAMPLHERIYVRAYAQTVRGEASGALRLWGAYLSRPEPEAPERRLAERHRRALEPLPSNLGGPARPGEAPRER